MATSMAICPKCRRHVATTKPFPADSGLLNSDPLWADQAVGIGGKAGELCAHCVEPFRVPEIDQRPVGEHTLGHLGVTRQPLGRSLDRARRVELSVDIFVAITWCVERRRRLAG